VDADNLRHMQEVTEKRPADSAASWSGFGCAGVGCISYGLFFAVQFVVLGILLFHAHPETSKLFTTSPPSPDLAQNVAKWAIQLSTAPNLFVLALAGDGVMILVAIVLARLILGARASQIGLAKGATGGQLLTGVLTGLGLVVVSQIVSYAQIALFGPHPEAVTEILKTHHGTTNFLFDLASICIIAPFAEELLFRGVIFAGLVQRMPLWVAASLSGIIFGAAHGDPWGFVPLAVTGAGLALLYYRTRSLWPNVLAHAIFNAVALVALYFVPKLAT
jgi:membrane protease YdiL (CAAX protease family)